MVLMTHIFNLLPWHEAPYITLRQYMNGGWAGVDLFFVISGFVITRNLLSNIKPNDCHKDFIAFARVFWIKRVVRLLPSAWLWLVIIILLTLFFNASYVFNSAENTIAFAKSAVLFIANYHFYEVGMQQIHPGAVMVYWSLSLEEQFYFLLPFLLFFSRKHLVTILIAIILFQLFQDREIGIMRFFRSDALCLGVLLAIWQKQKSYYALEPIFLKQATLRKYTGPLVLLSIIFLIMLIPVEQFNISYQLSLIAILGSILVWVGSYNQNYFLSDGYIKKAMLWIGSRSYAIYLIHMPAFLLTREIWHRLTPPSVKLTSDFSVIFLITAFVLLVTFAEINYRYIEQPLRRMGYRLAHSKSPTSQKK